MKLNDNARFSTICIHAGQEPDPSTGAIITPIYQTSTYVQEGLGQHKGFEYGRTQNPTRMALEANLAAIESGVAGFAFASGMAAIDALLTRLESGDHLVVSDNTYGGTFRLFERVRRKFGLDFTYVDTSRLELIDAGDHGEDEVSVHRDADQPDAADHRPGGGQRDRARAQRPRHRRQHLRQPLHPAAARARLRHRHPQHDQVPQRPQRQRRRHRRAQARGRRRVDEVRAERGGRDPRADGLVAGAARHQDAADPHGADQRQRAWRWPSISPAHPKVHVGDLSRAAGSSASRAGQEADARVRRADLVRRRIARGRARRSCRASS